MGEHIPDSELRAYLEGALHRLPLGKGHAIRAHLAVCLRCSRRLEQIKRARRAGRSGEGVGVGPGSASPGFPGKLVRWVRVPVRPVVLLRGLVLLLAVAAGWMGGEAWRAARHPEARGEGEGGAGRAGDSLRGHAGGGRELAVPGLEVISVAWEDWLPDERVLRIRQLLPGKDTLELRYFGMLLGSSGRPSEDGWEGGGGGKLSLPPAALEVSLPPGWNQVEMRWGRGWLVARAPLPEPSIRLLLRAMRWP